MDIMSILSQCLTLLWGPPDPINVTHECLIDKRTIDRDFESLSLMGSLQPTNTATFFYSSSTPSPRAVSASPLGLGAGTASG